MKRRTLLAAASGALAGCATTQPPAPQPIAVISFGGGFNLPLWAARDHAPRDE